MVVYSGKDVSVLFVKQSDYTTAGTPDNDIGYVQSVTTDENNNIQKIAAVGSRAYQDLVAAGYNSSLSVEYIFQHGRGLEAALGTVAHDATNTPDIKHTYTLDTDAFLPAYTMAIGKNGSSDIDAVYTGAVCNSLGLSLDVNGVLTARQDFITQHVDVDTTAAAQVLDNLAVYPYFQATVTTGGKTAAIVQSCNINFTNNPIDVRALGSRYLQEGRCAGNLDIEVSMKLAIDKDYYEDFLGGSAPTETSTPTAQSFELDITNGTALASGRRQVYFEITDAVWNSNAESIAINDVVYMDLTAYSKNLNSFYTYDDITAANWV